MKRKSITKVFFVSHFCVIHLLQRVALNPEINIQLEVYIIYNRVIWIKKKDNKKF
jgi:hypothetical protein